jgi:DNA-binding beta-propeller fold protein YncE
MPTRTGLSIIAVVLGASLSAPLHAAGLKQVGTISFPGDPIYQFGVIAINQATGLGYLADKDNKAVAVFDTRTDAFVARVGGFVGMTKSGNASGPNGIVVVNDGAEVWVSDGDSTIKVIDAKSGTIAATIATGGKLRANAMAFDPNSRVVIVANSNDDPPFLSLISTGPDRRIVARIAVPESGENLERSAYHAPSGTFYTVIPVLRSDITKGLLAQTDPKSGKIVKIHGLDRCHPHSLAIVSETTIFMGCSTAHKPTPKPGGDLAIFDIPSARIVSYGEGLGGNGGSAVDPKLRRYYHSTTNGALIVMDTGTRQLVQKVTTPRGSRSLGVSHANNRVYLATNAKDGPCGGCLMVFAPD